MRFRLLSVLVIVTVFTAFPGAASGQLLAEGMVVTDYLFRGSDILDGRPAVQPSVTWVAGETGLSANAWFSFAMTGRDEPWVRDLDEMDLTLAYERSVGPAEVSGGLFTLHWFTMDDWPSDATVIRELFAGVGLPGAPLSPSLTVNYELSDLDGHDLYLEADLEQPVMLGNDQPLLFNLHAGYYDADWLDVQTISDLSLSLAMPMEGKAIAVVPWFSATWIPNRKVNPSSFELVAGLAVSGALLAR